MADRRRDRPPGNAGSVDSAAAVWLDGQVARGTLDRLTPSAAAAAEPVRRARRHLVSAVFLADDEPDVGADRLP